MKQNMTMEPKRITNESGRTTCGLKVSITLPTPTARMQPMTTEIIITFE